MSIESGTTRANAPRGFSTGVSKERSAAGHNAATTTAGGLAMATDRAVGAGRPHGAASAITGRRFDRSRVAAVSNQPAACIAVVTVMTTVATAARPPVTVLRIIRRCLDKGLHGLAMRTRRQDLTVNAIERATRHGRTWLTVADDG